MLLAIGKLAGVKEGCHGHDNTKVNERVPDVCIPVKTGEQRKEGVNR